MSTSKTQIIFSGGLMRDLSAFCPRFPVPGETLTGTNFLMGFGGKTANQSVMCRRLGGEVAFIGKLGTDDNGNAYKDHMAKEGINCEHLSSTSEAPSGVASILVNNNSGENVIVIVPGSNDLMEPKDIAKAESLFKNAGLLVIGLEMNQEANLAALQTAKKFGVKTILNAAPGRDDLDNDFLKLVDILCVNETEAALISGQSVESPEDALKCLPALLKKCNAEAVILTLGKNGAAVLSANDSATPRLVPLNVEVKAVDTTGAGDAFVGALAYYLMNYKELALEKAIGRACEIAAYSVQLLGTQTSYRPKSELPKSLFE